MRPSDPSPADRERPAGVAVAPDDPRLRWRGVVSLQHGRGWVAPWRVPVDEAALHLPAGGLGRAAMPAGVRIGLGTDGRTLRCHYEADPAPRLNGPQEQPRLDVLVDGRLVDTVTLDAGGRAATFAVALPDGGGAVELWLPTYNQFRLLGLELDAGTRLWRDEVERPRWVHYGSSVSQGRGAASPSRAWVAQVARGGGLDLTSLALGAACHMQPMSARLMRDQPADLLSACVGINSKALGALDAETFAGAAIGFVRTVRDAHPTTPMVLMSTIFAPRHEDEPGPSGLTLRACRAIVRDVVAALRRHGDRHLHHLDGLDVFGASDAHLFLEPEDLDRLHPNPDGHALVAERVRRALGRFGVPGGADRSSGPSL